MNPMIKWYRLLMPAMLIPALFGCALTSDHSRHYSTSIVEYLYPDKKEPIDKPEIPVLSLPLRAGIAFVPTNSGYQVLSEREKTDLLNTVRNHFKKFEFIKSIDVIPSAYLTPKGSFSNLDQIATMFGIDVIALVSYDQKQFTDQGVASITYWTIVGAYIIPGEKNSVHTMLDTAVYDIRSRKMLFRAPGLSHIRSLSTPVNQSEQIRKDSAEGFKQASVQMIENLQTQLEEFKVKVRESPQEVQIVHRTGYKGGGYLDELFLAIALLAGAFHARNRLQQRKH